jgi:FAD/FMN-containing dehydrogenase
MDLIAALRTIVGPAQVLTGADMARYAEDWTGRYHARPVAAVRPASTAEVAAVVKAAGHAHVPVIASGGRTGLVGGRMTDGGLILSRERLNRIRETGPDARLAVVEAGVVLTSLH